LKNLLNILSVSASFIVVFGILFLIQEYTLGQIEYVKDLIAFDIIPMRYLVFTATSLIFILKFIEFYIPKRG